MYRAADTRLGRAVAIKVLPDGFAQDSDRMSRLERKARALASLNDPHIAAIKESEDSRPSLILVQDWTEELKRLVPTPP